ncbi:arsenite efflux MFS transporter ArsK [Desertibaculum subflavum]|uniref:arsenite efflux MFS transporter ArsK n=1 Tax=Desertibaculum subflavum TaxID=2268458 RepID=UPI000E66D526
MTIPSGGARPLSLGAVVWLLGLTQNLGYGTLYYSFAILAADMAAEFGWPVAWIYGAFSLALLVGGAVAPLAGRQVDRYGAATVMTWGSVAAAASLALIAIAPNVGVFVIGLIALQAASTYVLYDAAFAHLVQRGGAEARRRILHLTLIAGFASTMFWPLTSALHGWLTWREVTGLFAVANFLVCFPVHAWLRRPSASPGGAGAIAGVPSVATSETPLPPALRRKAFLLVATGFSLGGFLLSGILAQMVPLLSAVGLGTAAVLASTLFGPSQVLIRFINMAAGSGRHPLTVTIIAATLLPVAVGILAVTAPAIAGAVAFALLLGFGSGLTSIVRGTLPLALFGSAGYGAQLGKMASARLVLTAIAPFVLAFLVENAGAVTALAVLAATGALGLVAFLAVLPLRKAAAAIPAAPCTGHPPDKS